MEQRLSVDSSHSVRQCAKNPTTINWFTSAWTGWILSVSSHVISQTHLILYPYIHLHLRSGLPSDFRTKINRYERLKLAKAHVATAYTATSPFCNPGTLTWRGNKEQFCIRQVQTHIRTRRSRQGWQQTTVRPSSFPLSHSAEHRIYRPLAMSASEASKSSWGSWDGK
jgi:hypothetical protein